MRYDVIVIGAGSAGAVLAARLSEDAQRSALLLEAGPAYPDVNYLPDDLKHGHSSGPAAAGPHMWGYTASATARQTQPMPIPRGKITGGSSAVNGTILLRGLPDDFENWARWGNPDRGFGHVLPYFRKLERDLDFSGDFHGSHGPIPVRTLHAPDTAPGAGSVLPGVSGCRLPHRHRYERSAIERSGLRAAEQYRRPADQHRRVHGLQGLRMVDTSVMPDVVRANTNATTIMIAERLADVMRQGM